MRYFAYDRQTPYLGRSWDEKTGETMIYFAGGIKREGVSFTYSEIKARISAGYFIEIPVEEAVLKFNL